MPQIDQLAEFLTSQIFWVLVTFGLVFFVVGLGMVPKVQATVDMRDKRIADDLAAAQAAQRAAEESEDAHRTRTEANRVEALKLTAAAKAEAATQSEQRLAKADAALAKKVAKAEARIAEASGSALAEIESVAAESAQEIVARLAGVKVTAAQAASAVKAVLA